MTLGLFDDSADAGSVEERVWECTVVLRRYAAPVEAELLAGLEAVIGAAPLSSHGHAGRPPNVGGDDQLRRLAG